MKILNNLKFVPRIISNKNRTPLYLIFFVTSRCNMRCKHCFFWKEINKQAELSLKEIEAISKTLDPLLFLRLTGGEPFLRKDIPEVVGLFYKNAKVRNLGINTNGYFTEQIVNDVKKIVSNYNIALDVCISIDDFPEENDKNRGVKGAFEHAAKTLAELNHLKKTFRNLTTTIGLTVTSKNQDRFKEIFGKIASLKPDFISGNLIRGSPQDASLKAIKIGNYMGFISLIRKYNSKKHNFYFNAGFKDKIQSNIIKKIFLSNQYQGIKCLAGDKMAVLYSNGDLFPCESLATPIGNLKDFKLNFKNVWNSSKRLKIRKKIICEKCFCTHECFLSSSIMLSPAGMAKSMSFIFE